MLIMLKRTRKPEMSIPTCSLFPTVLLAFHLLGIVYFVGCFFHVWNLWKVQSFCIPLTSMQYVKYLRNHLLNIIYFHLPVLILWKPLSILHWKVLKRKKNEMKKLMTDFQKQDNCITSEELNTFHRHCIIIVTCVLLFFFFLFFIQISV